MSTPKQPPRAAWIVSPLGAVLVFSAVQLAPSQPVTPGGVAVPSAAPKASLEVFRYAILALRAARPMVISGLSFRPFAQGSTQRGERIA